MKLKQYLTESVEYEVKHKSGKSVIKTNIAPEDRSFKNMPKDMKGGSKARFQDWLVIDSKKVSHQVLPSVGKAANGKWYGWSHRAVYGFQEGDVIKPDTIGYKGNGKEYTLKNEKEAMEQAIRFADEVS